MKTRANIWAASSVALLVSLGGGVALDAACAPTADVGDAGDGGPVCDPDSGDPAGCPCDPGTVKTTDCYTGPPGTSGKGICQTGKRSCTPQGTYTVCEGEVTPTTETCNYADDDCNGKIDDHACANQGSNIYCCTYLYIQNDSFCYSSFLGDGGVGSSYSCFNAQ